MIFVDARRLRYSAFFWIAARDASVSSVESYAKKTSVSAPDRFNSSSDIFSKISSSVGVRGAAAAGGGGAGGGVGLVSGAAAGAGGGAGAVSGVFGPHAAAVTAASIIAVAYTRRLCVIKLS